MERPELKYYAVISKLKAQADVRTISNKEHLVEGVIFLVNNSISIDFFALPLHCDQFS